MIQPVCGELIDPKTNYYINNTGRFVICGSVSDTGMGQFEAGKLKKTVLRIFDLSPGESQRSLTFSDRSIERQRALTILAAQNQSLPGRKRIKRRYYGIVLNCKTSVEVFCSIALFFRMKAEFPI